MHTTTRRLQVGDKVRSRTGDLGTVVPLDEWPAHRPSSWTDENTVITHWTSGLVTAGMTGFDFSPFPRDVAEKILTLVELAPTLCQATVMAFDGVDSGELGPCEQPATGTRIGSDGAPFPACDEHAAPQGEPADIGEDDGVHRGSSQPALVQLDRNAAQPDPSSDAAVVRAALTWEDATQNGSLVDVMAAADRLHEAIRTWRAAEKGGASL